MADFGRWWPPGRKRNPRASTGRTGLATIRPVLPNGDVAKAEKWAAKHNAEVPEHLRGEYGVELVIDNLSITVVQFEPMLGAAAGPDAEPLKVEMARLRYVARHKEWTLYCYHGDLKPHLYVETRPTRSIAALLSAIDEDRFGIFWG